MDALIRTSFLRYALITAGIYASSAEAAIVLDHGGTVKLGTEYHSNLQFLNDKFKESVYVYSIVPEYKLTAKDENNEWYGQVGVNLQRSSNQTISGKREDPFAKIGWIRALESGELDLTATYKRDSTRTSQFTETGILSVDGTSTAKGVAAKWTYLITPKWSLLSEAGYRKNTFTGASTLSDYDIKNFGGRLFYQLSERIKPYAGVLATDYRANGITSAQVRYQQYTVGAEMLLSSAWIFDANVGNVQFNSSSKDEWVGMATATYEGNRYTVKGGIERSIFPTGLGMVEVGDKLGGDYIYDISDRGKVALGATLTQNKSGIDTQAIMASYKRELTSSWLMSVDAGARNLKVSGAKSANDKSIGVFFTYISPKF